MKKRSPCLGIGGNGGTKESIRGFCLEPTATEAGKDAPLPGDAKKKKGEGSKEIGGKGETKTYLYEKGTFEEAKRAGSRITFAVGMRLGRGIGEPGAGKSGGDFFW